MGWWWWWGWRGSRVVDGVGVGVGWGGCVVACSFDRVERENGQGMRDICLLSL